MIYRKFLFFGLILAFALIFGCVEYQYTQKVLENSDSTLTLEMDYIKDLQQKAQKDSKTLETQIDEFVSEMEVGCNKVEEEYNGVVCEVDGPVVRISKELKFGEDYEFVVEDSIPNTNYKLIVKKIPNLDLIGNSAGVSEYVLGQELSNEEKIKILALQKGKVLIDYKISVPGEEIVKAEAGEYKAQIEGNVAKFDLIEVGKQNKQIVIESKRLNFIYLYALIAVIIGLILLLVNGFLKNK